MKVFDTIQANISAIPIQNRNQKHEAARHRQICHIGAPLWRTVKYENLYLADHGNGIELDRGLTTYFRFYNSERPLQALGYRTPEQVHFAQ